MPPGSNASFDSAAIEGIYGRLRGEGRGRYTTGLQHSDLRRLRGDAHGNILVVRLRGDPNCPAHLRATLRTLRLHKPGDMRVGYGWDSAFIGQVRKLRNANYVKVIELATDRPFHWARKGRGMIKTRESYEDGYGPGEIVILAEGEYLQVDLAKDGTVSASWSAEVRADDFVHIAKQNFGPPTSNDSGLVVLRNPDGDDDIGEGTSADVFECVEDTFDSVKYFTIELENARIIWTSPYQKLISSDEAYTEVGIMCHESRFDLIRSVLTHTGTKRLVETARGGTLILELGKAGRSLQV